MIPFLFCNNCGLRGVAKRTPTKRLLTWFCDRFDSGNTKCPACGSTSIYVYTEGDIIPSNNTKEVHFKTFLIEDNGTRIYSDCPSRRV